MKVFMIVLLGALMLSDTCVGQDVQIMGVFPNSLKVVICDVTRPWTTTGITVTSKDTISVMATGIACTKPVSPQSIYWIGPEGWGGTVLNYLPVPDAAPFSVIGKIGQNGKPFYVGRNCVFQPKISGELFLGYNDDVFSDNQGYYIAYVFRVKNTF